MNEEMVSPYTVDRAMRRAMFPTMRAVTRSRMQLNRPTKRRRSLVKADNRRRNKQARKSRRANR